LNKIAPVNEYDANANKTIVKIAETHLNRSMFSKYYKYFMAFARAFLPLLLLTYLNLRIRNVVYGIKIKKKSIKSKTSITLMLLTIVLSFVICMFPDTLMTMMQFGYANETFLIKAIREVTDFLLTINSAITFLICFYFSIEFRRKLKRIFFVKKKKIREHKSKINFGDFDTGVASHLFNTGIIATPSMNLPKHSHVSMF
jgi:hypothetical protein